MCVPRTPDILSVENEKLARVSPGLELVWKVARQLCSSDLVRSHIVISRLVQHLVRPHCSHSSCRLNYYCKVRFSTVDVHRVLFNIWSGRTAVTLVAALTTTASTVDVHRVLFNIWSGRTAATLAAALTTTAGSVQHSRRTSCLVQHLVRPHCSTLVPLTLLQVRFSTVRFNVDVHRVLFNICATAASSAALTTTAGSVQHSRRTSCLVQHLVRPHCSHCWFGLLHSRRTSCLVQHLVRPHCSPLAAALTTTARFGSESTYIVSCSTLVRPHCSHLAAALTTTAGSVQHSRRTSCLVHIWSGRTAAPSALTTTARFGSTSTYIVSCSTSGGRADSSCRLNYYCKVRFSTVDVHRVLFNIWSGRTAATLAAALTTTARFGSAQSTYIVSCSTSGPAALQSL
ncbi:hypothetical protein J6590_060171 [Homalodisca vitripennis]|nr:hypothetical protein J6590_060171 [Homalodisca vitripennis]